MPFERGKPPVPPAWTLPGAGSSQPRKESPAKDPGDTSVRENLSRTHVSLKAIREELEEFEKEIKWRDERLVLLERELQEARTALESERSKVRHPDGASAERLREARQQIEQNDQAVRDRDARIQTLTQKGRELLTRVQALTQERTRSAQALAEMVKQIQEQQRRTQALEARLLEQQQRGDQNAALLSSGQAAGSAHGMAARWHALQTPGRLGIIATALLIAGGSIGMGTWSLLRTEPRYRVTSQLVVPRDQADVAQKVIREDVDGQSVSTSWGELDTQAAALSMTIETARREDAIASLDQLGHMLVQKLTPPPVSQPDTSGEGELLERRLADLEGQLGGLASQPAEGAVARQGELLKSWREQLAERQEVEGHLRSLRPRLAIVAPDPAHFTVDAAKIGSAQSADAKLQADAQALFAKQQQVRVLLRKTLDPGEMVFNRMVAEITSATKGVNESSQEVGDPEVTQATGSIVRVLADWTRGIAELREAWHAADRSAQDDAFDGVLAQARLEPAVRSFIDRAQTGREAIQTALEMIGQGGEEPTKRIVLRNTLSRQLESALAAQQAATQAVRPVVVAENAELAGLVQSITGLRAQVQEQKDRIAAVVRSDALMQAQQAYDQAMTSARAEHERWLKKAAELDEALLDHNRKVLLLLPQLDEERSAATRRADLYRERAMLLRQLADLSAKQVESMADRKPRLEPRYVPAQAMSIASPQRLSHAMFFGSLPLLVGALAVAAVWAGLLWFRSRQLAEDYEKLLREASRQ